MAKGETLLPLVRLIVDGPALPVRGWTDERIASTIGSELGIPTSSIDVQQVVESTEEIEVFLSIRCPRVLE